MYYLIEYSDVYLKTSGNVWQYYRDEPALDNKNNIIDFPANSNNIISFKLKQQITGQTENRGTKNVKIIVPLKYLSNFRRTIEMPLINCEVNLHLKWSEQCILVAGTAANEVPEFKVNDTKLYVPVVTLSAEHIVKLLKKIECGFKWTINWNKYKSKESNQAQNRYLDFLIDPSF